MGKTGRGGAAGARSLKRPEQGGGTQSEGGREWGLASDGRFTSYHRKEDGLVDLSRAGQCMGGGMMRPSVKDNCAREMILDSQGEKMYDTVTLGCGTQGSKDRFVWWYQAPVWSHKSAM